MGTSRCVALAHGVRGLGTPAAAETAPRLLRRVALIFSTDLLFRLALGDGILDCYIKTDQMLGEIISKADKETIIMIMSDHAVQVLR